MSFQRELRLLAERLTRTRILPLRDLPRGIDVGFDLAEAFPDYHVEVIFDVGANVGQSAQSYLRWFPKAFIYCFEPARGNFNALQASLKGEQRVRCENLAFGSCKGEAEMALEADASMHHILSGRPAGVSATERIAVDTVDSYCQRNGINRISFLKIDTEGWDLEVLRGASRMLASHAIDFVEVEAGMNPGNTRHVSFERLGDFLQSNGYQLFAIYEQVPEWPTRKNHLRRTNPLFLSPRM